MDAKGSLRNRIVKNQVEEGIISTSANIDYFAMNYTSNTNRFVNIITFFPNTMRPILSLRTKGMND